MTVLHVDASVKYDVIIENGILDTVGERVAALLGNVRVMIVSDDIVADLYMARTESSLDKAGISHCKFVFPNGESSKCADTYIKLLNTMAEEKLTRSDAVIALGGGVVGDLTGFAAATFLRGIHFVQIPTTVLAAVDSSVGGKTAIDLECGKNLVGAFYQPKLVLCDPQLITTLPEDVYADGCAEVIKYGMIRDAKLLDRLCNEDVKDDPEAIFANCIAIKRDVVANDEFDHGERQLLNFGHTFGHSIEKCSEYEIPHGRAVAIGMAMITRAAVKNGMCSEECLEKLEAALKRYGLPTESPYTTDEMIDAVLSDKKRAGAALNLIVPDKVGNCIIHKITIDEAKDWLEKGKK